MAYLYRPTQTKPIPEGAEFITRKGERLARWAVKGGTRMAPVTTTKDGTERLAIVSPYWRVRYRDGAGVMRDVPTRCKDQVAAERVMNDLVRRADWSKPTCSRPPRTPPPATRRCPSPST